jgi:hypothetical protein
MKKEQILSLNQKIFTHVSLLEQAQKELEVLYYEALDREIEFELDCLWEYVSEMTEVSESGSGSFISSKEVLLNFFSSKGDKLPLLKVLKGEEDFINEKYSLHVVPIKGQFYVSIKEFRDSLTKRTCSSCKEEFLSIYFSKSQTSKDGLSKRCRNCK